MRKRACSVANRKGADAVMDRNEREETHLSDFELWVRSQKRGIGRPHDNHRVFSCHYPDHFPVNAFDPVMVWLCGRLCSVSHPYGYPESDPGTGALRPSALWVLRPHRFCGSAHRLWAVGGTHAAGVLRTAVALFRTLPIPF